MSLASKLDSTKTAIRAALPPTTFDAIERSVDELRATGLAGRAVEVGDLIVLPVLTATDGTPLDLLAAAAGRPVVLVFTRGGWCPYCNTTVRAYEEARDRIEGAGGIVLAVTPDIPAFAAETSREVSFAVAVDRGNRFAKSLGLVFALPEDLRPLYLDIGIDLSARNGDASHELPIPATYVLAPTGRVTWAHVDADFTQRADPADAVAAHEKLAAVPLAERHAA